MGQTERYLQREITTRLRFAPLDAILVPSPNGIFVPTRSPAERTLAQRIVHQLKIDGQLTPGAPDLVFLWHGGSGCMELKRPAARSLLGKQRAGALSEYQRRFRDHCIEIGVPYEVVTSWPQARDVLKSWGRLPANWKDPEQRVGKAA